MRDVLAGIKEHQRTRDYRQIIHILNQADIDKLVEAELADPDPRFIIIDGDGPTPYGIEEIKGIWSKYKFVSFPWTSDFITDPGYDFWIMWAIDFTRKYNVKLNSELEARKKDYFMTVFD